MAKDLKPAAYAPAPAPPPPPPPPPPAETKPPAKTEAERQVDAQIEEQKRLAAEEAAKAAAARALKEQQDKVAHARAEIAGTTARAADGLAQLRRLIADAESAIADLKYAAITAGYTAGNGDPERALAQLAKAKARFTELSRQFPGTK